MVNGNNQFCVYCTKAPRRVDAKFNEILIFTSFFIMFYFYFHVFIYFSDVFFIYFCHIFYCLPGVVAVLYAYVHINAVNIAKLSGHILLKIIKIY